MGYKIRAGTWDSDDMTDEYLIRALPFQPDQPADKPWADPARDGSFFRPFVRLLETGGGARVPDGAGRGRWIFGYWTLGMYSYWRTTFCGGGYSGTVTLETLRLDTGAFDVFNCTIQLPDPGELARRPGGYEHVAVEIVNATEAA